MPLNAPWGETITLPNVNLTNPWQNYPGGNPFPTGTPSANFQFPVDGTYVFEPLHAHATYVQQWNVALPNWRYPGQVNEVWGVRTPAVNAADATTGLKVEPGG